MLQFSITYKSLVFSSQFFFHSAKTETSLRLKNQAKKHYVILMCGKCLNFHELQQNCDYTKPCDTE